MDKAASLGEESLNYAMFLPVRGLANRRLREMGKRKSIFARATRTIPKQLLAAVV